MITRLREVHDVCFDDGVSRGESLTHHINQMKVVLATGICTLAVAVSGCIKPIVGRSITGTFKLLDSGVERSGSLCYGTGGYSDIETGLKVVVKDERGKILGISSLGADIYEGDYPSVVCLFPFVIEDLPKAKFYAVEVGRRGEMIYSYEDLVEMNWEVGFSLG